MKNFKIFLIVAIALMVGGGVNLPVLKEAQAAPPTLAEASFEDFDHNGAIDRIKVRFDTYVISCKFEAGDWVLSDGSLTLTGPTSRLNGVGLDANCDGSTDYFYLRVSGAAGQTGYPGIFIPAEIKYKNQGYLNDVWTDGGAAVDSPVRTISDNASPVIVSTSPAAGSTGVLVTTPSASMTFSEPMATATVLVTLSGSGWESGTWSSENKTITYSRTANLSYDTVYTVLATGEDKVGYRLSSGVSPAVPSFWNFTTESAPVSTIVSASQSTILASPTSVTADGSSVSAITVKVKNAAGSSLSGKTVTLSSNRGATDTIVTMVGTTGADGRAVFQVRSSTAGSSIFTATASGTVITQTAAVTFTAVAPTLGPVSASRSSLYVTPSSVTANNSSYATVYVTARDASDNLLSGKTVTLSSNRGSTDTISIVSGTTNSSGQATFQVKSGTVGTATLTAVADGTTITQTSAVTFTAVAPTLGPVSASRSSLYVTPSSVTANNSSYATVYVTVRDASDNLLSGKTVTLSSNRGSTDTISIVSGTTNSSGQATFQVKSGSVGTATLTAVADGTTITQTSAVTFTSSGLSLIYGDLFKESGSTAVYYYADNGKRYVFPTSAIYFSWYSDFSTIKTVSHSTVTSVSFGGNVIVKPGSFLVQFVSMDTPFRVLDPKVYVLTSAGQLRWVTSAGVAASFYGADWERKIVAVPEVYKTNYGGAVAGADVNSTADYSKASVEATARTISDLY